MTDSSVSLKNTQGTSAIVLVCEHASAHIPPAYRELGLSGGASESHIAWDPGASTTAMHLSKILDAVLIQSAVSRLVYDCNRPPEAHDAIPEHSEIYTIPGNENLSEVERQHRVNCYYRPFENTLSQLLQDHHSNPVLVTVHSFTPVYKGVPRDVELGILHDDDSRIADAMLNAIPETFRQYSIQRNKPYDAADGVTHTLKLHGVSANRLNVMLEIRNDLLKTETQCLEMAQGIATWLTVALDKLGKAATAKVPHS